ncbi:MAG: glycosyltransferase [Acidobacteriia bacterium]|nr:glycosyltransferase [Terriglobia bacterium]
MKILVVGPQYPDSFARSVAVTLTAMGHQVMAVDGLRVYHQHRRLRGLLHTYLRTAFPAFERVSYRGLIQTAKDLQPNLVLVTYGAVPPVVIRELKESSRSKIVCWYTDAIMNLHRLYLIASDFDAFFLKEPFLTRILREKLGLNAYHLPECCNPIWHRRIPLTERDHQEYGCDLSAIGTLHYYRARMLEPFDGYDLKVWGSSSPKWLISPIQKYYRNHYVAEEEKAKALLASKVVINTIHCAEIEGVNCTLFEVAGCGAFQIADWKPDLPQFFEPEYEVVTFRTRQELKEKVNYYLGHPEERKVIAERAYARAHREHTYEIRLKRMFEILKLPSEGQSIGELAASLQEDYRCATRTI